MEKERKLEKAIFNNGVELGIGDELGDGSIVYIEEEVWEEEMWDGGFEDEVRYRFVVVGGGEGWDVYINKDGVEVDGDGW